MLVRTLGPLELEGSDLRRPKPLLFLTYLALEGPQTRRHASELFWLRAANPLGSLSMALTQLRKASPGAVDADHDRVWTNLTCDAVAMTDALDEGNLLKALDLYRAPFLDGLSLSGWGAELEDWVVTTRERLAARVRHALIDAAEQAGAREQFDEARSRAETALALVSAPPLEPRDISRLHRVLTASGSPTTAELRKEAAELGIELNHSVAAARSRLKSVPIDPSPHNLPTRHTSFVGRSRELALLQQRLRADGCRLVTVLGPGGVGKTRLVTRAGHAVLATGTFPDGVYLVSLDSSGQLDSLATVICETLDLEPSAGLDPLAAVADRLSGGSVLLILDGMERFTEEFGSLSRLLDACPGLKILATSRQRLNLVEEQVLPVGGLAMPDGDVAEPTAALRFDAVDLFVRRAKRSHPGFELTLEGLPAVLKICRLVDGLPLAIELSAVWTRALSVDDIAAELAAGIDLLSTPIRNVDARHSSMHAAIDHSWRSLTDREREVMLRLATFRGGFTRDATFAVANATIDVVADLVDKSLLRRSDGRYDLHPLVQRFALAKLREIPTEYFDARSDHAAYFSDMVVAWRQETTGQGDSALMNFRQEIENVRQGWSHFVEHEDWPALAVLASPLRVVFDLGKRFRAGMSLFGAAAEAAVNAAEADDKVTGVLLKETAWLTFLAGEHARAAETATRALHYLEGGQEPLEEGMCRNVLASALWFLGDFTEAGVHWREALELAAREGQSSHVANYSANLALVDHAVGNYESARASLETALTAFESLQDDFHVVRTLNKLGVLLLDTADPDAAERCLRRAVSHAREHDLADEVPQLLVNLGVAAFDSGRCHEAADLTNEALRSLMDTDDRYLQAFALARLGWIEAALGNEGGAFEHFGSALKHGEGIVAVESEVVGGAAFLRCEQERDEDAVTLLSALEELEGLEQPDLARYQKLLSKLSERMTNDSYARARASGRDLDLAATLRTIKAA